VNYTSNATELTTATGALLPLIDSAGRGLPHDVEAERLIITALCVAVDRQPFLELLKPDDFSDPFLRLIFQLLRSGQDVPGAMVRRKDFIRQRCGVDHAPTEFSRLMLRRDGSSQCGRVVNLRDYLKRIKELSGCRQRIVDAEQELSWAWMESEEFQRG
jgi:replicative DNA helicase